MIFDGRDQRSNLGGILTGIEQDWMADAAPHVDLSDLHGCTDIETHQALHLDFYILLYFSSISVFTK